MKRFRNSTVRTALQVMLLATVAVVQAEAQFGATGPVPTADSRSGGGRSGDSAYQFSPWVAVNGAYSSTSTAAPVSGPSIPTTSSWGGGGFAGINGTKLYEHDSLAAMGVFGYQEF